MEQIITAATRILDWLYLQLVAPLFAGVAHGLELLLLRPMEIIRLPSLAQVLIVAVLTAGLSMTLRRLARVEEKESAFKKRFAAKHGQHAELQRIGDWRVKETMAKAIDNDLDEDFNTYLAGRFARFGSVYLLPLFLSLFWLQTTLGPADIAVRLPTVVGGGTISGQFLYLLAYGAGLFTFFRWPGRRLVRQGGDA